LFSNTLIMKHVTLTRTNTCAIFQYGNNSCAANTWILATRTLRSWLWFRTRAVDMCLRLSVSCCSVQVGTLRRADPPSKKCYKMSKKNSKIWQKNSPEKIRVGYKANTHTYIHLDLFHKHRIFVRNVKISLLDCIWTRACKTKWLSRKHRVHS
jgi:hypothetical protein